MSIKRDYEKKHLVQILKINSEHSELVKSLGQKVGDIVVTKMGDFHNEINKSGFLGVCEFGICDGFELKDRFQKITESQLKNMTKTIVMRKNKEQGLRLENDMLREELAKLKDKKPV